MPANRRGRPGSHPISKFFRRTFENKKTRQVVGAGLTIILMFSGLLSNVAVANELSQDETMKSSPESRLITEETLTQPFTGGVISQNFHGLHRGIDILAPIGTEIRPIAKGRVIEKGFSLLGYGNSVVVQHENGLISRYAHMKEIKINLDQEVDKNVVLGSVGMTGWTTGSHLHLEIYQNGRTIDPRSVLPEFKVNLALGK